MKTKEIFLVNISEVYELVKITQNETNNSKMSEMQTAERKEMSPMDNSIKMNTIIVNSIGEEIKYRYDKTNIRMPVFMDDIATTCKSEHIRKHINNSAKIEKEKKISFGLKSILGNTCQRQ